MLRLIFHEGANGGWLRVKRRAAELMAQAGKLRLSPDVLMDEDDLLLPGGYTEGAGPGDELLAQLHPDARGKGWQLDFYGGISPGKYPRYSGMPTWKEAAFQVTPAIVEVQ